MASRKQMLEAKRKYLLGRGYPPGIIEKALSWAVGSAEGTAKWALGGADSEDNDLTVKGMADRFLPKMLDESEKWIKSFGHEPKENTPTG